MYEGRRGEIDRTLWLQKAAGRRTFSVRKGEGVKRLWGQRSRASYLGNHFWLLMNVNEQIKAFCFRLNLILLW